MLSPRLSSSSALTPGLHAVRVQPRSLNKVRVITGARKGGSPGTATFDTFPLLVRAGLVLRGSGLRDAALTHPRVERQRFLLQSESSHGDGKEAADKAMCPQLSCLASHWLTTQRPGPTPLWAAAWFLVPHHPVFFHGPGMAGGEDEEEGISEPLVPPPLPTSRPRP